MAIKDILEGAVDVGKSAVTRGREVAERRLRGGSTTTADAPKPGEPRGPKSATASTRAQAATASTRAKKAKPKAKAKTAKAKAKPAKRSTATRAAAKSGKEVSDAAKGS